jgi:hypothetical protein
VWILMPYEKGMDYPSDPQHYGKECPRCGKYLSLDTFGCRKMPSGPRPQTWCKPCRADKRKQSNNDHRVKPKLEAALLQKVAKGLDQHCSLKSKPDYIANEVQYLVGNRTKGTGAEIDLQRSRVYACDSVMDGINQHRISTLEDAQKRVDDITSSQWWKNRFGETQVKVVISSSKKGVSRIRKEDGINHTMRLAFRVKGKATDHTVLHELAHIPGQKSGLPHGGHGPLFCAVLIDLYSKFGPEGGADALRELYESKSVRHTQVLGQFNNGMDV